MQEGIYDQFEKKLAGRMESWTVGDPFSNPCVNQGPQVTKPGVMMDLLCFQFNVNKALWSVQVDKAQYERVLSYIDQGKREGATVLTGGEPFAAQKGYYIAPTVFTDVKVHKTEQ